MFWTVPVSDKEITTSTPIGVKSITHVFFEDRNGGVMEYSPDGLQTVSVVIDGKQIMQDVPVLPFCTSTPGDEGRYNWRDVALDVNINVNISEIKVSAARRAADFSIIFVTSPNECDATYGYDYVEYRQFILRANDTSTYERSARSLFAEAREKAAAYTQYTARVKGHDKWLAYAQELTGKMTEQLGKWQKLVTAARELPGHEEDFTTIDFTIPKDAPQSAKDVEQNIDYMGAAYKAVKPGKGSPYDALMEAEVYSLGDNAPLTLADGTVFPTDYISRRNCEQTWQTLANAHALAVGDYINSLHETFQGHELRDYNYWESPDDDEQAGDNAQAATLAYNEALGLYSALTDEEKASKGEPQPFTGGVPASRSEFAVGSAMWRDYAKMWAKRIADYAAEAQKKIDGLEEYDFAIIAEPADTSQVTQVIRSYLDFREEAANMWQEMANWEYGIGSIVKNYFTDERLYFPEAYTVYASAPKRSEVSEPDGKVTSAQDGHTELDYWNVPIVDFSDANGNAHKTVKRYIYAYDEACKFEYGVRQDWYEYRDDQTRSHMSYEYSWVRGGNQEWEQDQPALYYLQTVGQLNLTGKFGEEDTISLQKAPKRVVAMSVISDSAAGNDWLLPCDVRLNFNMSSDVEQVFMPHTDLELIEIKEGVPYARAAYDFEEGTVTKNMRFAYFINLPEGETKVNINSAALSKKLGSRFAATKSWRIYLMFIYKKLA